MKYVYVRQEICLLKNDLLGFNDFVTVNIV